MSRIMITAVFATMTLFAGQVSASDHEGYKSHATQGEFQEVFQDLQDAVVNRGYVIDFIGHIDMMLERTSATVGSVTASGDKSPFLNAKYLQFCAAKLTHEAVSASPFNVAICPYVLFAFEARSKPGHIIVGYRHPVAEPSKRSRKAFAKIEALLDDISKEATSQ